MLQAEDIITLEGGPYRLRAALGNSAYGVVWRAQAPDGADVALKLVNQAQMARAQPALQQRWSASADQEIAFLRTLAPWDERHIVRLLDSGTHDGLPVLALELMDSDLARRIATEPATPIGEIVSWMAQLNQALAKVHQYGWLYLDLKPANVLLNRFGGVKLADFGTSRPHADAAPACYAGTASWQAPEQFFASADGTYDADTRSDYFALGALFYFLVTGGRQLRFCSDCGQAYRDNPSTAAATIKAGHGGRLPTILRDEEAALFSRHCASAPALSLLRALLQPERDARPQHALHISRMLAAI